jgi:hypothetical protein
MWPPQILRKPRRQRICDSALDRRDTTGDSHIDTDQDFAWPPNAVKESRRLRTEDSQLPTIPMTRYDIRRPKSGPLRWPGGPVAPARNRDQAYEQGIIPTLTLENDQTASAPEDKARLSRELFFPEPPEPDLSDIESQGTSYRR